MANRPKNIQYGTSKGGGAGKAGGGKKPGAPGGGGNNPWLIVGGVVAAIIVITIIVIAAANDKGGEANNDVAYAPVKVTGAALADMPDSGAMPSDDPAVGQTIPTVTGQSFDGSTVTIEPGKPQIIAVIAHWCPHCQKEVPAIAGWQADKQLPSGVTVTAVSTAADEVKGNFPPASWLEKEEWKNPTLVDSAQSEVLHAMGATGFPTLIAVTKDGKVARRASGELTLDQVKTMFDAALGKDTSGENTSNPESSPIPTTTQAP
jgi:thiol-disulfide isomerase/thioredoxin